MNTLQISPKSKEEYDATIASLMSIGYIRKNRNRSYEYEPVITIEPTEKTIYQSRGGSYGAPWISLTEFIRIYHTTAAAVRPIYIKLSSEVTATIRGDSVHARDIDFPVEVIHSLADAIQRSRKVKVVKVKKNAF